MKTILLVDGGYLRAFAKMSKNKFSNDVIDQFCRSCFSNDEYLFRIMYYDAFPFDGKVYLPISGAEYFYEARDEWLEHLAKYERFAVRLGNVAFRGWRCRSDRLGNQNLTDNDFEPIFEQKGVDMRIGLDIATIVERRQIERLLLLSGDTDMVPAMKY